MINWKNLLERAAWTFVEAFLVALPATISLDMTGAAWKSALMGAACAGLSALKTFIIDMIHALKPPDAAQQEQYK
jgi:hypothetical protein